MPTEPKSIPIHVPHTPGRIVEGIYEAIADPKTHPQAYIRLTVSGGIRGEAYDFEYRIDAKGQSNVRLRDELKNFQTQVIQADTEFIDPKCFATLVSALDIANLIRCETQSGGFPPDSVVGRLEISDGDQKATFLFLANEEQAKQARLLAPDPLRKAVDTIYRTAATHLRMENVRP
jgi:hypothetical protein